MRPALQRLLASHNALSFLKRSLRDGEAPFDRLRFVCNPCQQRRAETAWALDRAALSGRGSETGSEEVDLEETQKAPTSLSNHLLGNQHSHSADHSDSIARGLSRTWKDSIWISADSIASFEADFLLSLDNSPRWDLCLELIRWRLRHQEAEKCKIILRQVMNRRIWIPAKGQEAEELWRSFTGLGHSDPALLEEVFQHVERMREENADVWPGLYRLVAIHLLQHEAASAQQWHRRLGKLCPPTLEDYQKLYNLATLWGVKYLKAFELMIREIPVPGVYSIVIVDLCRRNQYLDALRWHYLLLKAGDTPKTFLDCKQLLHHFSRIKDERTVESLVKSLAASQIWHEEKTDAFVRKHKIISRELLNLQLGEAYGIEPKPITDHFCARLFATKLFPVDVVISGLQALGAGKIGHESLRAIAMRADCIGEQICQHIDRLREGKITIGSSRYTNMLREAAIAGHTRTLRSLVYSDLHADAYEDLALQERLLAQYYESEDHEQIRSTLSILLYGTTENNVATRKSNILLRCFLKNQKRDKWISVIESMLQQSIELDALSLVSLRQSLLVKRVASKRPQDSRHGAEDLILLVNLMKVTMVHSQNTIPIDAWKELLRRLGMTGKLIEFRKLALWLVERYGNPAMNTTQTQVSIGQLGESVLSPPSKASSLDPIPSSFSNERITANPASAAAPDRPKKPKERGLVSETGDMFSSGISMQAPTSQMLQSNEHLLSIFTVAAQQAIIAWGFQSEIQGHPNLRRAKRDHLLKSAPDWQWGPRLLKELQLRGLPIRKADVAKACRHRLLQLFEYAGLSRRPVNRRAKELNQLRARTLQKHRFAAYVKGLQDIWGEDLFGTSKRQAPWELVGDGAAQRLIITRSVGRRKGRAQYSRREAQSHEMFD